MHSESAWNAYREYLDGLKADLRDRVQAIVELALHDARIFWKEISIDTVELLVADRAVKTQPTRVVRILFAGVSDMEGLNDAEGRWLLYDEIHLNDDGTFDYCALLDVGEVCIRIQSVRVFIYCLERESNS